MSEEGTREPEGPHAPAAVPQRPAPPQRVEYVVAPGLQLLDLAGPAQVFGTAAEASGRGWAPSYIAEAATVLSHQGLPLRAETEWQPLDPSDLLVVPGWQVGGPRRPVPLGAALLDRIAAHHAQGGTVMSVCAGAFALARAGLLDGRRATTHPALQDELARVHPTVRVVRDVLFVRDGRILTSAGIASGIDLALDLVAQRLGPRLASRVARAMVVYVRRNGHAPQESVMLRHRDHVDDLVHRAQDLIDDRYAESLSLTLLARELCVSERTLTRAFSRTLGTTPLRYQQSLRRECAQLLVGAGADSESAARAVGFRDGRMLRTLRRRSGGITPP
jgi:transcriptional regulator GlxA family with amidase domain